MKRRLFTGAAKLVSMLAVFLPPPLLQAAISGPCADCHTMHNSQGRQIMAILEGETGPYPYLTRGSCIGCHAQGSGERIVTIGTSQIPQVYHQDVQDLAAGNFAYISGHKGGSPADSKGHNVIDLLPADARLAFPPGALADHQPVLRGDKLTCAGTKGCHGVRLGQGLFGWTYKGLAALRGAHHRNVDGLVNAQTGPADSYRFLDGVKGLENPIERWQNNGSNSHNEYFGVNNPGAYLTGGWEDHCRTCHGGPNDEIDPPHRSISGFCATCHPFFHSLNTSHSRGIGSGAVSPFVRHPSDIALPNASEYAAYTIYNINAPVGRPVLPVIPSGTVTPGTDVVICLSCHMAHASPYSGMLRWDYTRMIAGNSGEAAGTGCFICHTTKDD